MRLTIEVYGDTQIDRELLRFDQRGRDMRPALTAIADEFLALENRQFASQGLYASGGWAPLRSATIARKARLGLDPRILHATLRLRRSLTQRGGTDAIRKITADELQVGSKVAYGVHHQHGAPRASLPRRRPVELRESDRRNMMKIIQRYLIEGDV